MSIIKSSEQIVECVVNFNACLYFLTPWSIQLVYPCDNNIPRFSYKNLILWISYDLADNFNDLTQCIFLKTPRSIRSNYQNFLPLHLTRHRYYVTVRIRVNWQWMMSITIYTNPLNMHCKWLQALKAKLTIERMYCWPLITAIRSSYWDLLLTYSNFEVFWKLCDMYSLYHSEEELVTLLLPLPESHSSFNSSREGVLRNKFSSEGNRPVKEETLDELECDMLKFPLECVWYAESSRIRSSEGDIVCRVVVEELEVTCLIVFVIVIFSDLRLLVPEAISPSSIVLVTVSR